VTGAGETLPLLFKDKVMAKEKKKEKTWTESRLEFIAKAKTKAKKK